MYIQCIYILSPRLSNGNLLLSVEFFPAIAWNPLILRWRNSSANPNKQTGGEDPRPSLSISYPILPLPGWSRLIALLPVAGGIDAVHEGNQRQEHRDDDAADNHGQNHDHDGFQKRRHGRHRIVHFLVIVVRNLQ